MTGISCVTLSHFFLLCPLPLYTLHTASKSSGSKRARHDSKEIVDDEESEMMRKAMANSLQENHAKGDVLININLPRGNVDFSLTESSNGLCVAGQLPAAASAATSASTEIRLGDVIISMNDFDFQGIGNLSVWNEKLESAKNSDRVLLVSRRVVPGVNHGRVGLGMDSDTDDDDEDVDDDVLSLPFCQGKHDISFLLLSI